MCKETVVKEKEEEAAPCLSNVNSTGQCVLKTTYLLNTHHMFGVSAALKGYIRFVQKSSNTNHQTALLVNIFVLQERGK